MPEDGAGRDGDGAGRTRGRSTSDISALSEASGVSVDAKGSQHTDSASDDVASPLLDSGVAGSAPADAATIYAPAVVDRYPPRDYKNKPLEPFTANFSLPVDDRPLRFADDRQPTVYTFVLTNSARELTFGTTLRFCEPTSDPGVFMPKALCVLSSHAWLAPLFEGFLLNLHKLTMFRVLTLPLEVYIQHFVEHASLPRPGSTLRFLSDATFIIDDQGGNGAARRGSEPLSLPSDQSKTASPRDDRNVSSASVVNKTSFLGLDALAYHRAPSNTLNAVRGCVDAHFKCSCLV